MANLELAAAFGAADAAKEQDLRGYYPMAARVLAEEVLDTLDPEDTAEADELRKLINTGEVLALTTLANSRAPEFECQGEPSLCTNPRGCACVPDRPPTPGCHTPEGCSENGCLGWCDEYKPGTAKP